MTRARIRRKDLKKPDEFVHLGQRVLLWSRMHRAAIMWSVGAAAALLVVVGIANAYRTANLRRANEVLAQGLAATRSNDWAKAVESLNRLQSEWPNTAPGRLGSLVAAQLELREKRFDQAQAKITTAERGSALSPYLEQQLLLARALTLEGTAQYDEAAKYAERAANLTGPYTAPSLYEAARLFLRAGNEARARELVDKLQREHASAPESTWTKFLLPAEAPSGSAPSA